jgi:hypothetical protein
MSDKTFEDMLKMLNDFDRIANDINAYILHLRQVEAYRTWIGGLMDQVSQIIAEQNKNFVLAFPPPVIKEGSKNTGISTWKAQRDSYTIHEREKLERLSRWHETLGDRRSSTQTAINATLRMKELGI